ncbi:DUF4873 domain-containing protein [Gordonia sp. TBRC 11910]|uniref:DUF4873 domain-containing protein n=1 Tax=Gordonia asplenii TaxID=2725283 RepID=A0A848L0Z0_9ACTN|nr:DUF4873 domain-containing protein [Gordonia asplenii]NMO04369.1 DUF4873 domain-containing protein [Gordonia asplenii]
MTAISEARSGQDLRPTIAIDGRSGVLDQLRRRASRLGIHVDSGESTRGQLVVVEGVAPQPNYLGVIAQSEPGRIYCSDDTLDYVVALVAEYTASGATGVRVRGPVLNEWAAIGTERKRRRRLRKFDSVDFDWDTGESTDSDVFDETVTLLADGEQVSGRIRVQGYLNPSDGQFHWAGTAYGDDVRRWRDERIRNVEVVTSSGQVCEARLTDVTPWGTVRLVGEGMPPR